MTMTHGGDVRLLLSASLTPIIVPSASFSNCNVLALLSLCFYWKPWRPVLMTMQPDACFEPSLHRAPLFNLVRLHGNPSFRTTFSPNANNTSRHALFAFSMMLVHITPSFEHGGTEKAGQASFCQMRRYLPSPLSVCVCLTLFRAIPLSPIIATQLRLIPKAPLLSLPPTLQGAR